MKTFRIVLLSLSIVSAGLLFRCDSGSTGGVTGVAVANTVVSDANGELGKAVSIDSQKILLITSTGHLVCLKWDGTIIYDQNVQGATTNGMQFTGSGCTGTPFLFNSTQPQSLYPKFLWISAGASPRMFVVKTFDEDGRPYYDSTTPRPRLSILYQVGTTSTVSGTGTGTIECVEVTNTDIGLPATITVPLTIQFK